MRTKTKKHSEPYAILAVPDIHTPAHDPVAIAALCARAASRRYDAVVILGDTLDFESISRFVKDSPKKLAEGDLLEEFAIGRKVIKQIVDACRKVNSECNYWQLQGNHESRLLAVEDHMPMLRGMFDLPTHLGLADLGGTWVPSDSTGQVLRFEQRPGRVVPVVLHPDEVRSEIFYGASFIHGFAHGMHNAKATADMFPWPGPVFYGHVHTRQIFTAKKWGPHKTEGATCGWLGLPAEYIKGRPTGWQQAFAEVYLSRDIAGDIDFVVPKISNGRILVP